MADSHELQDFLLHADVCRSCRAASRQESFETGDLCEAGAGLWARTLEPVALPDPFDPNPPKLTPAQHGYIWCDRCDAVQEAAGHECRPEPRSIASWASTLGELEAARAEVEACHSLLCALAFDHGTLIASRVSSDLRIYGGHSASRCVFCEESAK